MATFQFYKVDVFRIDGQQFALRSNEHPKFNEKV